MPKVCDMCGKSTSAGRQYARRGRAKRLGGVGIKITGVTKRTFSPNLQRVWAVVNGAPKRIRICAKCLKSGKVTKPAR